MKRALAVAAAAGAVWGAAIPLLLLRGEGEFDFLVEVGRFLAVAWALGLLARDWRAGAAVGAVFVLAFSGAMEVVPWHVGGIGLPADDAQSLARAIDAGTGLGVPVLVGAVGAGAAGALWHSGGRARSASAAVLAGALAADLVNRLWHPPVDPLIWLAGAQAAAGVAVAWFATRGSRRALLVALVPIALVLSTVTLLAGEFFDPSGVIGVIP